jgi:hypothetical protein
MPGFLEPGWESLRHHEERKALQHLLRDPQKLVDVGAAVREARVQVG